MLRYIPQAQQSRPAAHMLRFAAHDLPSLLKRPDITICETDEAVDLQPF